MTILLMSYLKLYINMIDPFELWKFNFYHYCRLTLSHCAWNFISS